MVYKGRYRITGLNPYTNLAFLCCHFYREATDTIWTEGKRDVTLYKIVDMMNFIRFYREQINYDIMIEVLKKLNIEKKAYFTFKIMTEFYEYEFLSEMLSRLDEYKSGDDEMKAIHDTKNKTTIYRDCLKVQFISDASTKELKMMIERLAPVEVGLMVKTWGNGGFLEVDFKESQAIISNK